MSRTSLTNTTTGDISLVVITSQVLVLMFQNYIVPKVQALPTHVQATTMAKDSVVMQVQLSWAQDAISMLPKKALALLPIQNRHQRATRSLDLTPGALTTNLLELTPPSATPSAVQVQEMLKQSPSRLAHRVLLATG